MPSRFALGWSGNRAAGWRASRVSAPVQSLRNAGDPVDADWLLCPSTGGKVTATPDGVVAGDAARVKIQNPKATTPPHGAPFLRWRGIKANPSGHQRRGFSPTKSLRLKNFEQVLAPCPASCFAFAHPFSDGLFCGCLERVHELDSTGVAKAKLAKNAVGLEFTPLFWGVSMQAPRVSPTLNRCLGMGQGAIHPIGRRKPLGDV